MFNIFKRNNGIKFTPVIQSKKFDKKEAPIVINATQVMKNPVIFNEIDAILINHEPRKKLRKSPAVKKK